MANNNAVGGFVHGVIRLPFVDLELILDESINQIMMVPYERATECHQQADGV